MVSDLSSLRFILFERKLVSDLFNFISIFEKREVVSDLSSFKFKFVWTALLIGLFKSEMLSILSIFNDVFNSAIDDTPVPPDLIGTIPEIFEASIP